MKLKGMYKNYNLIYRLRLLNMSLAAYILGFLVAKDLAINGKIVFAICIVVMIIYQIKLIRLEKHIPK